MLHAYIYTSSLKVIVWVGVIEYLTYGASTIIVKFWLSWFLNTAYFLLSKISNVLLSCRYVEQTPQYWHPEHSLVIKEIENVNKMKMAIFFTHTMNFQDLVAKGQRKTEFILELKTIFDDLEISYHLLPQEIHLTKMPSNVWFRFGFVRLLSAAASKASLIPKCKNFSNYPAYITSIFGNLSKYGFGIIVAQKTWFFVSFLSLFDLLVS